MPPSLKNQRQLAFIRILAGLAWADGELSVGELNRIKHFLRRFDLPDEHWPEVEMVLLERMTMEECLAQVEHFLGLAAGPGERRQLADALEELAAADGTVCEAEQAFIRQAREALATTSSPRKFLGSLQGLLRGFAGAGDARTVIDADLELFTRNRLLYRLNRRMTRTPGRPADRDLEQGSLVGGLLGLVLEERGDWSPPLARRFTELLDELTPLADAHLEMLAEVVLEDGRKAGLDQARLTVAYRGQSDEPARVRLVEAMFRLARADRPRAGHQTTELIRRVAYGLGVPHDDFVRARVGTR